MILSFGAKEDASGGRYARSAPAVPAERPLARPPVPAEDGGMWGRLLFAFLVLFGVWN